MEIDEPVTRADGSRGIVDLMFSRNIQLAGSEDREHLVVELKRPDVKIDAEVVGADRKLCLRRRRRRAVSCRSGEMGVLGRVVGHGSGRCPQGVSEGPRARHPLSGRQATDHDMGENLEPNCQRLPLPAPVLR